MNSRPLEPHSSTLPNCATPRYYREDEAQIIFTTIVIIYEARGFVNSFRRNFLNYLPERAKCDSVAGSGGWLERIRNAGCSKKDNGKKQSRLERDDSVLAEQIAISAWRTGARGGRPSGRTHLTLIQKVQYSCGFSGFPLSVNP